MKKFWIAMLLALTTLLSAPALAEEIVLPDPAYYFGKAYTYDEEYIVFDEYPKAEFDAYTTLLINEYGLEITDVHSGKSDEFFFMTIPDIMNTEVFVACGQDSEGVFGMRFDFSKNITLRELDVYAASEECAICGGDAVCDICEGRGYLEMTAYDSKKMVRVVCIGGCADGKCTACGTESDTPAKSYAPPIVGNDGLTVMSPEQYLGIDPCNSLTISDDGCYVYHYYGCGKEWRGDGSNEKWAMLESYVQALVDSGYYEVSDYEQDSYVTEWRLRYIGPAEIIAGPWDIEITSFFEDAMAYYRPINITPDDLEEKLIYFNMDAPDDPNDPDAPSIWETCDTCDGDGECNYCWGRGTDGITGGDCSVCKGSGDCYSCRGKGRK